MIKSGFVVLDFDGVLVDDDLERMVEGFARAVAALQAEGAWPGA